MRNPLVGAALVATAVTAAAAPAAAQESVVGPGKPSVFHVTPYVGYVFYGDWFDTPTDIEYTNDDTGILGVEASLDLGRVVALVGNFGYSRTRWQFEGSGLGTTGDVDLDKVGIWVYDGSLRLRLPVTMGMTSFAPYVQGGAGAMRFTIDDNDFSSRNATTNVAYNVGVGATWQFAGVGLRGEVKDYISSFQWDRPSSANSFSEIRDDVIAHNWAVSLGLTIGF